MPAQTLLRGHCVKQLRSRIRVLGRNDEPHTETPRSGPFEPCVHGFLLSCSLLARPLDHGVGLFHRPRPPGRATRKPQKE
jgi:hypothetical protein